MECVGRPLVDKKHIAPFDRIGNPVDLLYGFTLRDINDLDIIVQVCGPVMTVQIMLDADGIAGADQILLAINLHENTPLQKYRFHYRTEVALFQGDVDGTMQKLGRMNWQKRFLPAWVLICPYIRKTAKFPFQADPRLHKQSNLWQAMLSHRLLSENSHLL